VRRCNKAGALGGGQGTGIQAAVIPTTKTRRHEGFHKIKIFASSSLRGSLASSKFRGCLAVQSYHFRACQGTSGWGKGGNAYARRSASVAQAHSPNFPATPHTCAESPSSSDPADLQMGEWSDNTPALLLVETPPVPRPPPHAPALWHLLTSAPAYPSKTSPPNLL
jgi:hypothetical protein